MIATLTGRIQIGIGLIISNTSSHLFRVNSPDLKDPHSMILVHAAMAQAREHLV
jgi:hypothetical protein